jgi:hypothetical protein
MLICFENNMFFSCENNLFFSCSILGNVCSSAGRRREGDPRIGYEKNKLFAYKKNKLFAYEKNMLFSLSLF